MVTKEFLEQLKVGDYIKATGRYNTGVEKIVKITNTQIVTNRGLTVEYRYNKVDGKRRASGYLYSHWMSDSSVSEAEKSAYESAVAEEIRMKDERERTGKISKAAAEYLAAQLGMPVEKTGVYVQSNDGLKTVTWTVRIEGIPEENILAMLAK